MEAELTWDEDFKNNASYRLNESLRMIRSCMTRLSEEDVWKKPNPSSNSVGNLILHLCGNISQYVISSLGEKPDLRQRDEEFAISGGMSKTELMGRLEEVLQESGLIISGASEKELLREREVQGFTMSGLGVVLHVVEHLSYHTGQIAFWTKLLKDEDLGFYDGFDLNIKNS